MIEESTQLEIYDENQKNIINDQYFTPEIIMMKVKNPETGSWMNRDEIEIIYEAMKKDICTERLVPNYKDKTNRILEQEWNIGKPL